MKTSFIQYLIVILLIGSNFLLFKTSYAASTTYTTVADDKWSVSTTWSGSSIPDFGDSRDDILNVNNNVTESGSISTNKDFNLTIAANKTLYIYGNFTSTGNGCNITLNSGSKLIIYGTLDLKNNFTFNIPSTAILQVTNFTCANNVAGTINGSMDVTNNISLGGGSGSIGGTGTLTYGGTMTNGGTNLTCTVNGSANSDIMQDAGFTYPTNINYTSYTASYLEAARFTLRDGGGATDNDTLSTIISSLTVNVTNPGSLSQIGLYNYAGNQIAVQSSASSVTFAIPSRNLSASDNSTRNFSIRVTFNTTVTDNQQFSFTINKADITVATQSSRIVSTFTSVSSSTTGDNNRIEVTATKLVYNTNPSITGKTGISLSTQPVLWAVDNNNNKDLDYTTAVSLSISPSASNSYTAPTTTNGEAIFTDFKINAPNTYTLTASSGSLTNAVFSSSIIITDPSYTWINTSGSNDWTVAGSWSPSRNTTTIYDILNFTNGGTPTATSVPNGQTVAQINVSGNTNITLTPSVTATLTIGGGTGTDLSIAAGSTITLVGTGNPLSLSLATGTTGIIYGTFTFNSNHDHHLMAADASSISFESGAICNATLLTGNPFFDSGTANTVIFKSGSIYNAERGSNPFGLAQPNSKVVFQSGSKYVYKNSAAGLSLPGRTYADVEFSLSGTANSAANPAVCSINNLTITSGTVNLTNQTYIDIKGNFTSNGGTFNYSPDVTSIFNINGTSQQTISGSGTITIGDNVDINVNNTNKVILNKDLSTADFSINAINGKLEINPNVMLTVRSGYILTNTVAANLLIKSDATGTGSLIHYTDGVAGTVQRYMTGGRAHIISSPHNSTLPASSSTVSASNVWWNMRFDEPSSNTAAQGNSGWIDESLDIIWGLGYSFKVTNDQTVAFTGNNMQQTDNLQVAVNYTSGKTYAGWNLVGNPYTSGLTVSTFLTANSGNLYSGFGAIYLWDGYGMDGWTTSDWLTYNGTGSSTGSGDEGNVNNIISSSQGFYIKVASSATNVVFNRNMRAKTDDASTSFFKSKPIDESIKRVYLGVFNSRKQYSPILVGFTNQATDKFDQLYDALKLSENADLSFYSQLKESQSEHFAIQGLADIAENKTKVVPLGLTIGYSEYYTFKNLGFENLPSEWQVYLEDLELDTLIDLKTNSYNIKLAKGNYNGRFRLIVKNTNFHKNNIINDSIIAFNSDNVNPESSLESLKTNLSESEPILNQLSTNANSKENLATGIFDQKKKTDIKMFSSDKNVIIYTNENYIKIEVVIYNILGYKYLEKTLNPGTNMIPFNHPAGYYIIKVIADNKIVSGKLYIR